MFSKRDIVFSWRVERKHVVDSRSNSAASRLRRRTTVGAVVVSVTKRKVSESRRRQWTRDTWIAITEIEEIGIARRGVEISSARTVALCIIFRTAFDVRVRAIDGFGSKKLWAVWGFFFHLYNPPFRRKMISKRRRAHSVYHRRRVVSPTTWRKHLILFFFFYQWRYSCNLDNNNNTSLCHTIEYNVHLMLLLQYYILLVLL